MATGVTIGTVDGKQLVAKSIAITASGDSVIVSGSAGLITRIYKLALMTTGGGALAFKDGSTALTGVMTPAAGTPLVFNMDGQPWFTCSAGNDFVINDTGAALVSGVLWFTQQTAPVLPSP